MVKGASSSVSSRIIIELDGLTKYYRGRLGIEGVTFVVREGETFGIIGPDGAGKSTVLRTLLNLVRPTRGSATVFGMDSVKKASVIARQVGYMPATVFQHDGMTVLGLLRYALSFYRGVDGTRMLDLAQRMGLDLSCRIEDLSFSEKKRAGFVQALAHRPQLIILDEPTKGLDPPVQQAIREVLREEGERGTTILFCSHAMSEVQLSCDRFAIMDKGKLLETRDIDTAAARYKKVRIVAERPLDVTVLAAFTQRCAAGFGFVAPPGATGGIPSDNGVSNLAVDGANASFTFRGDLDALVAALGSFELKDLTIEEPSLEEVFLYWRNRQS